MCRAFAGEVRRRGQRHGRVAWRWRCRPDRRVAVAHRAAGRQHRPSEGWHGRRARDRRWVGPWPAPHRQAVRAPARARCRPVSRPRRAPPDHRSVS